MNKFWYPGCPSSQLKDKPFGTQVLDKKIVLFRDQNDKAYALLDRCCHRGFPLSCGSIKNGKLACGYHGWEFNGSGQCEKIPSQSGDKAIPRSHFIPQFSCEEKDGYVWIWADEAEKQTSVPEIPEIRYGKWIQGSRIIECNYLRALEITYDGSHLYFVHPTHPSTLAAKKYGLTLGQQEIRSNESGCVTFSPPAQNENEPIPPHAFRMVFSLPSTIRFEMPGFGQGAYMIFFTTPLSNDNCRMDWLIANMGMVETSEQVLWTGEGREIIEEDQIVLERIQKAYSVEGESFEKSVEADIPTLTLRKIVNLAKKNEWPAGLAQMSKRRVFDVMGPAGSDMPS